MELKVGTQNLTTGMYICGLDRPWLDTPFVAQGHLINDDNDIAELKVHCNYVYIDTERGIKAEIHIDAPVMPTQNYLDDFLVQYKRRAVYRDQKPPLDDLPAAETALETAFVEIAQIMDNTGQDENLDLEAIKATVRPLLDSMISNVEALSWLSSARGNEDIQKQATDNCALALVFARHLGLYREDRKVLAMGMLLLDVGKLKISADILNKPGSLTKAEFTVIKKHVEFGVKILRNTSGINESIIGMVQTHHERFDGSGYPSGLEGEQIPVCGLIAAIIDTYNAMTRKTLYRGAIAHHKALQELYRWRDKYFHGELVDQFLQCLGAYSTGELVEMTSGEVGIVIAQNPGDRLRPTVSMLLDELKNPWEVNPRIDLSTNRVDENGIERNILRTLKPGAYGIDESRSACK